MSDSTQPAGGDSTGGSASEGPGRKRPTLAPMASSVTNAPMKTRPPMTPLPPLAPRPPPPPEPVETSAKKSGKGGKAGLLLVLVLVVAGAGYYLFLR
jgi:hypothetical protein